MLASLATAPKRKFYPTFKRIFDLSFSLATLLLTSPLCLLIGIAIRCDSKGPIFYCQERAGRYDNPFTCYKFRTMYSGSDDGGITTACKKDKISRVGRVLRKYKLDELPQLLNVLKGEMSVVGPRPTVHRYVSIYPEKYDEVLQLRPGITGLASIKLYQKEEAMLAAADNGEYAYIHQVLPLKLRLNVFYVRNSSPRLDTMIIYWTAAHVCHLVMKSVVKKITKPMQKKES